MEQHVEEMELSQEELAQRKEEMLSFYTESMPYLKAQFDYENLLMQIDECRFKRAEYQLRYAMMMNPQLGQEASSPEELREEIQQEQKERKLKKS